MSRFIGDFFSFSMLETIICNSCLSWSERQVIMPNWTYKDSRYFLLKNYQYQFLCSLLLLLEIQQDISYYDFLVCFFNILCLLSFFLINSNITPNDYICLYSLEEKTNQYLVYSISPKHFTIWTWWSIWLWLKS